MAIKDDADPEDAETFTVTLSNPSAGTTIAPPATATVTIDASDQPQPPPLGDISMPVLSTSAKTPQRLRTVLKRGAAFTATTNEGCLFTADLTLAKRLAKRLKLPRRIGRSWPSCPPARER